MRGKKAVLWTALALAIVAAGVVGFYGYNAYQCSQLENRLRNLVFQDYQQDRLTSNMRALRIERDAELFDGMRQRRKADMEAVMTDMLDRCGSDSVDTALRRAATEDFGL